ncbi:MAG: peptide MFS transporter [Hyphomicrobiales bacterium]|nr:peptide MFS transporter [Hyphomicrobiales bacterium]
MTSAHSTEQSAAHPDLFGHPRALSFLFATEMWERFSYYGMRALLVLYMTKYLLLAGHAGNVAGLAWLKAALEQVFGPLDVQPLSSQIYGFYTALVYLTPIFGGLLADRVLGQRRTVVIGAALMAIGHFMMAVQSLFLFALLALILGNGAFKPNISTQVGGLYAPGDRRRDRAYSIFYVGINIGAFLAPLVCGTLGETAGFHYGFAAAGVGMLIGLSIYLYAQRFLPPDELQKARAAHRERRPLDRIEWRGIAAILVLFIPTALFWATYEQQGNTIVLWADANTDRTISLFGHGVEIPTTWFLAFNPFMIFAFTPFIVALWSRQAARGTEPSTVSKMALGCFGAALAYLIMAAAAAHVGAGKASWLWLFAFFVVITIGELYLSPVGLSLVTKIAPLRLLSMMMGVWLATSFVGGFLAGTIGSFWSRMDKAEFFLMAAAIAALAGLIIFVCRWPLRGVMGE